MWLWYTTLVYRGYHPLRNGDSYQCGMTQVPTWLTVRVYWDEPRRSTYHFTSSIRIRLARPRCRGNRHGPQPAAPARPIERACSKTVVGRRLGHFSRTAFVTSTGRFCVVSFISLFLTPQMPPKSRARRPCLLRRVSRYPPTPLALPKRLRPPPHLPRLPGYRVSVGDAAQQYRRH